MTEQYYADLFEINGKGCVIMGHGKTRAIRRHTGEETKELSTDMTKFDVVDGELVAMGALHDMAMAAGLVKETFVQPKIKVDYFIYMRDVEETTVKEITEVSKEEFCKLAEFNATFPCQFPNIRIGADDRRKEFAELLENADVKCIAVPWCDTMEEKGVLVAAYVK